MNNQKDKLESVMRELWEDYGNIGEEFLETAHELERDGEISTKTLKKAELLITKVIDIADRLQRALWGGEGK